MVMKKIVVLYGGVSEEREISQKTGLSIANALTQKGYQVHLIDTADDDWVYTLATISPDAVFVALHGRFGEDGKVQGVLESLKIPYTGSGVRGSVIAMDKLLSKYFFENAGFHVPKYVTYTSHFSPNEIRETGVGYPVVVKPRYGGSTIGLHIVENDTDLVKAINDILEMGDVPVIEEFIKGRELTLGAYKNIDGKVVLLPLIEIVYGAEIFDYETKYTAGAAKHLIPAPVPESVYDELERKIPLLFETMSLDGIVRFDFMFSEDGILYVLEVNTIPGMTSVSLVPDAARHMGLAFEELVEEVLKTASYGKA
ncbi:D-alanine--D-alanine ligase [bacterium 3DAC]|nr:D-alanine--D-alanine ligase [bacterium 3DAC]